MIYGNGGHASVLKAFVDEYGPNVVAIGDNRARKITVEKLMKDSFWRFTEPHIHPTAFVAPGVQIGEGTVVMAGAIIQPGARIGRHCIVNSGASVDHGCVLEDYVHIAPGAHLCGDVFVGEGALIGVCVGIAPKARITAWHLVKARSLEVEPLPSN